MDLSRKIQEKTTKFTSPLKIVGDVLQYALPLICLIVTIITENYTETMKFVSVYAFSVLVVYLCKCIFNAPRPFETVETKNPSLHSDWSPVYGNSFPSGHTMSAAIGGLFLFYYGPIWGFIGTSLALLTAYTRMAVNMHWARDVFTSFGIAGILVLGTTFF